MWDTAFEEEEEEIDISDLVGASLYDAAQELCQEQIPEKCDKDFAFLTQVYKRQITSDCKGFQNSITQKRAEADAALASAEADVRSALKDSLNAANKYDLGQCTIKFKECMQTTGGCGTDFSGCASVVAMDNTNSINLKSNSAQKYQIKGEVSSVEIAASTYDTLVAKKVLCESVTKQCAKVADQVFDSFLRNVAPLLHSAELIAEDNVRTLSFKSSEVIFNVAARIILTQKIQMVHMICV